MYLFLAALGFSAGMVIAAGVFALITTTGVITRMADKTHTAGFVRKYESVICLGGIGWNLFWIFGEKNGISFGGNELFLAVMGMMQGIFVGCLAVSLAEALNGIAIFSRRVKLAKGVGTIILFTALGKTIWCFIHFWM